MKNHAPNGQLLHDRLLTTKIFIFSSKDFYIVGFISFKQKIITFIFLNLTKK